MNHIRKYSIWKLMSILFLSLTLIPFNVSAQGHKQSLEMEDLLPKYNNFTWTYFGLAEYGHNMSISSITKSEESTHYYIQGNVHDMSGGESDSEFSLQLEYIVNTDSIIQIKEEETMLDSNFDQLELIRGPLEEGTTWSQEVEEEDGSTTILECSITNVEASNNGKVFAVLYEDTNSPYYEKREIQEGIGVISLEKLMFTQEGETYKAGYSIMDEETGLELNSDFYDVSEDTWYYPYVSKLVTQDLIQGYSAQTFKPMNEITIAEFIKLTLDSLSFNKNSDDYDVWYTPYISEALDLNIISEGEYNDYNRPITRKEMTKIIIKALDEDTQRGELDFADAGEIDSEYVPYIYKAVELGLISGYPSDNTFGPNKLTTRAEASKLFSLLSDKVIDETSFGLSKALSLEEEFYDRLYQDTYDDNWDVQDFDNKEDLIDYIASIADRKLVENYVDTYYDYIDGEFVLIPKDGPTRLLKDRSYRLEMIHPRQFQLIQDTHTEMIGDYTLTITYTFEDNRWIIKDYHTEVHKNN
ncbi:MAG: S-layer homology domain-containing protein [Eubacteriales bacterium]